MLGNLNLSLARRTMLRQLGWAADFDGATENLQITNPKNVYSGEYSLKADFSGDVVGQAPAGWTVSSGAYQVKSTDPSPFGGVKYLECTTAGVVSIPCNQAYGRWSFDWYKGNDNNQLYISFLSDRMGGNITINGYIFNPKPTESIEFRRSTSGSAPAITATANSYFANNTWYKADIYRLTNGQWSLYISGGAFGNTPVLISTSGGSGTNPITDNTYTSSNYFVLDVGAGDRIANIQCEYASGSLDLFGWERFSHSGNRDFEQATNYGPDLFSGYNFTSGWAVYLGSISSANSFTTDGVGGNGGIYKSPGVATVGRTYRLDIAGNTTASSIAVYDGTGGGIFLGNISGNFNSTFYYTVSNAPTTAKGSIQIINQSAGTTTITMLSLREVKSDWQKVGNHDCYVSGEEKYSGSNCLKVASTGAGDSNNCIFIAADKFLTLIAGKKFCSQRRIKTSVDCTMSVQFGDKVVARAITAGSWVLTPWTFEATAGTVNQPCKIWFDKAVTAYMDEIGLAEHFPTTISIWFKTGATSGRSLINKSTGTAGNSYGYNIRQNLSDKLTVPIFDGSGNIASITTVASFNDGKWHLATAIIDASASNTINLYVDGVSVATTNQTFGNTNNTQSYMIGRYSYYADAYWSGQLGQIQQIRGIKTASQILADFKGGIARRNDSMLNLKFSGMDDATMLKDYSPLNQLVTGINVTKAGDQVRGAYPYYSR